MKREPGLPTRRLELAELLLAIGMTSEAIPHRARRSEVVQYLTRLTGMPARRVAGAMREAAEAGFVRLTRTMVEVTSPYKATRAGNRRRRS